MSLENKILAAVFLVLVPVMIGSIWSCLLNKDKHITVFVGCKLLIQAWVYGNITMFALMQLFAVPMICVKAAFISLLWVWVISVAAAAVAGIAVTVKFCRTHTFQLRVSLTKWRSVVLPVLIAVAVALLIAFQARISSKYQHLDEDDARFIALEVIAVERDVMFLESPITGNLMYWNVGEVKKDYFSPWTMYVAALSKLSGMPPAVLSHRMLPLFLIPLCYMAYALLAMELYEKDYEKILIFLLIIGFISLFGYTSTHTPASLMLLRIWQGKAVFAALVIPVLFTLLWGLYEKPQDLITKALLFVTCMAASLLSGGGIIISVIAVGVYGVVYLLRYHNIRQTILLWFTCAPCIVYALCNVLWYHIFSYS